MVTKLQPKRIAAIRTAEALAIINYYEGNKDTTWLKINYLDMNGLAVPQSENDLSENMPVLPVSRCMENEWCDENF